MECDPKSIYEERTSRFHAELGGVRRKDLVLGTAKLLIALVGLVLLYRLAVSGSGIPAFSAALTLFVAAAFGHGSVLRAKRRRLALIEIQAAELNALDGRFPDADNGAGFEDPDHPFSSDLDLFGPHSLFHVLNRTTTKPGRDR